MRDRATVQRWTCAKGKVGRQGLLVGATCAAIGTLLPVAAHQLGMIEHLPDPDGAVFASDEITGSAMAHPMGVPDSLPGLASYGTTLTLAVLAKDSPTARRLLAGKLVLDGCVAAFNVVRQVVRFGKICSWCTGTAMCTAVMVVAGGPLIAGEARAVVRRLG